MGPSLPVYLCSMAPSFSCSGVSCRGTHLPSFPSQPLGSLHLPARLFAELFPWDESVSSFTA